MNIPALAIKHKLVTILSFAILLFLGIAAYWNMPQTEDPVLNLPSFAVTVVYPGASPVDIEKQVVEVIETSLNQLADVKTIYSKIEESVAFIVVEFDFGIDTDEKLGAVQAQVNTLTNQLPEGIFDISVDRFSTTTVSILQVALVSENASYKDLFSTAEILEKQLEKISGTSIVDVEACPKEEVRIALTPVKMTQMNIALSDVENAIQSTNANIPGGVVRVVNRRFNIKTSGAFNQLEQIENTIVGTYEGKLVYLKDIARVFMDYEDEKWKARYNGKRCIFINLQQKEGVNVFSVLNPAKQILATTPLPENMDLKIVFDQSKEVKTRTASFMNNLFQGIGLIGLIILLLLGFRPAVLVMLAVPFSLLMGLWVVDLAGFGLQQLTITALIVALGLLVDNSIVIVENIERFLRNGENPKDAAIKGTQPLVAPIASATLTTILAFAPMLAIQNTSGAFLRTIPITVISVLAASFIIAVTLTPFLASKLMKKHSDTNRRKQTFAFRALQHFVEGPFHRILSWTYKHKSITIAGTLLSLIGAFSLFPEVGISLFPKAEKPLFRIQVTLPEGSNLKATDQAVQYVEGILSQQEAVDYYVSNIGRGNPRIYYNMSTGNYSSRSGEILVFTKAYDPKQFTSFLDELRKKFKHYSAAQINVIEFSQGPTANPPVIITIQGGNLKKLQQYANEVAQKAATIPGIINLSNPIEKNKTDLFFNINRDKAMLLGVPLHRIDETIRNFVNGKPIGKFLNTKGKAYNMVMRYDFEGDFQLADFDKLTVQSLNGFFVPIKQVTNIEFKETSGSIKHIDFERVAKVEAGLGTGFLISDVLNKLGNVLDKIEWNKGYSYRFEGVVKEQDESFGGLGVASILALLMILSVLIIHFQSFSQPLIVFTALPLAFIGSILALYLTNIPFSFTAFIGLTSLIGISVNNSLVLVDYANELRQEGKSPEEAVLTSAKIRFIPILMTTLTTVLGLLPLTLTGGSMWAPMGWVIIGGLLSSTFFILLVVPILYQWFTKY